MLDEKLGDEQELMQGCELPIQAPITLQITWNMRLGSLRHLCGRKLSQPLLSRRGGDTRTYSSFTR